ncbi:MAG: UvrD-helicase domain-containing protein [Dehalococcoidia bacterium]|nr:UvrD-helicase domain-containing protein [Dehalococcoidia bacterium]
MMTAFTPIDQAARDKIRLTLGETMFVEAGAGTGKTTSMVSRVVNLIGSGKATVDRVAAITFTNSAASELQERIREELEKAASDDEVDQAWRDRCAVGVEDIDRATFTTLHSFAGAILRERPLEAGLPPSFETMDQVASDLDFDEKWNEWLDWALDDSDNVPTLPVALSLGLRPDQLREIALEFHKNYDLLEGVVFDDTAVHPHPSPLPRIKSGAGSEGEEAAKFHSAQKLVDAGPELERLCGFSKLRDDDRLFQHVQSKLSSIRRLNEMEPGSPAALGMLSRLMPLRMNRGRQGDWNTDPTSGVNACKQMKDYLQELHDAAAMELDQARGTSLPLILSALRDFVVGYEQERKREGRAGYHDLLVWARNLLRDNIRVRDHFRQQYTHLLLDEAQDTDPIQMQIAMFIAEDVPDGTPPESRPTDWRNVKPADGRLFVVGDPKQSIYRFRRADVRQLNTLRSRMNQTPVNLDQNFRSHRPIIDWVNHLFSNWMEASESQAEYVSLRHRWENETGDEGAPSVWELGDAFDALMGKVRALECQGIASALKQITGSGWQIRSGESNGAPEYRAARYSDICILMPTRTGLRDLEVALDDAGVPYRLEGSSLIFDTQEVRDLLNCLRAIDDPEDEVAIVAALRSPAFACTDVDLLRYYESGGRFDYLARSSNRRGPVAEGLEALGSYHERRMWSSVAALIDGFVRERPLMTAAVDHPRRREQWRRYRFIVAQARAFTEAGGGSLRSFLEWIDRLRSEGARVTETPVPETDEDAVRIMTVHGSKGLEFPVVILTGLNNRRSNRTGQVLFGRQDGHSGRNSVEVKVGSGVRTFQTAGYEDLQTDEKAMLEDEHVRLLYVATTRAMDHLVLSMYRRLGAETDASYIADHFEEHEDMWRRLPDTTGQQLLPPSSATDVQSGDALDAVQHSREARSQWIKARDEVIGQQGRPTTVAATRLAEVANEETKDEQENEEPWRRGRAGTQIGRAVHAVLQTIDLATGNGIDETARAQAYAEGIPGRVEDIIRLSRVAVRSSVVKRAVESGRYWREVPVGVPIAGGSLQGFIDLLFEDPDGLVIVDYKTDSVTAEGAAAAAARYRPQAAGYALAIQRAMPQRKVAEVVFLFLEPHSEESMSDIEELTAEGEALATDYLTSS